MLVGVVRTFRFHVPVFGYRSLGCSWSIVRVHPRPFCRIPQRNVRSDLDPDLRVLRQVVVQRRLLFAVHLLPRPSDDRFLNQLVAELDRLLCLSFVLPVEEDRQNCPAVYADRSFVPSLNPPCRLFRSVFKRALHPTRDNARTKPLEIKNPCSLQRSTGGWGENTDP